MNLLRICWKTIKSLKFAIFILTLLAVLTLVGVVIPQKGPAEHYVKIFGASTANFLKILGIFDIYHSLWYQIPLAFLCLSLLFCAIERLMIARSFSVYTMAITHLSIILICIGALITSLFGLRGMVRLSEGQTKNTIFMEGGGTLTLPFSVQLDDFFLEYDEVGRPNYLGDLVIYDKNGDVHSVNPVEQQGTIKLDDMERKILILQIIPDFVIDMDTKKVETRSPVFNNPAIQVRVLDEEGHSGEKWLFGRHPDFHGDTQTELFPLMRYFYQKDLKDFVSVVNVIDGGKVVQKTRISMNKPLEYKGWKFFQNNYDPDQRRWTGLEVSKDPGVFLIYLGSILLCIGVCLVFYVKPYLAQKKEKK